MRHLSIDWWRHFPSQWLDLKCAELIMNITPSEAWWGHGILFVGELITARTAGVAPVGPQDDRWACLSDIFRIVRKAGPTVRLSAAPPVTSVDAPRAFITEVRFPCLSAGLAHDLVSAPAAEVPLSSST